MNAIGQPHFTKSAAAHTVMESVWLVFAWKMTILQYSSVKWAIGDLRVLVKDFQPAQSQRLL